MASIKRIRLSILLELFLDATLLLAFIIQAFVIGCLLVYGYLPLPTDWGNRLIAQNLPAGTTLRVDEFRLLFGGYIDLVGIEFRSTDIQQPLFEAASAEVELQWNGSPFPKPANLVLSGGTLFIPSIYSPDGHHRSILERIAFRLIPEQESLRVDRFAALHESIRLRGSFELPILKDTPTEPNLSEAIKAFYAQAAKLSQQQEYISYFQTPTIAFAVNALDARTQKINLRISSRSLLHPEVSAENVQLLGSIQLQDNELEPLTTPRLTASRLEIPRHQMMAKGFSAEMTPDQLNELLTGKRPRLRLAAEHITLKQFELDAPILQLDPHAYPEVAFSGATRSLNGAIGLNGIINAQLWSGHVRARGSVDLASLASTAVQDKLPNLTYESAPYYDVDLRFNPGFELKRADVLAQVHALNAEGLTFDHINAHASYQDGRYAIEDLYLRREQQWLDLKFNLDTETSDFGITLIGSAVPYQYNALLPHWWGAIFKDFDFSRTDYSLGDFIIYGNTQRKTADLYFGHAEARKVSYKGVALDSGQLIVRGRGRYSELNAIEARSSQGWARGKIAFASRLDHVKAPLSVRLDLEAKLTLQDASKLFRGNLSQLIGDFQTDGLPVTKLKGVLFNQAYPEYAGKSYFDLSAKCMEPVSFKGLPLDHLSFDLYGRAQATYLRGVQFGYANGRGTAKIDILTPTTEDNSARYRFTLNDADQNQALHQLPHLNELEDSLQTKGFKAGKSAREDARLDIEIHGEGPANDPLKHTGFGRFEIRNNKLGTIQLLGPLSRFLQSTQFSFTSFNLNKMRAEFRYQDEQVYFDPLRIDGPRTLIRAPGTLDLSDLSLDMRVSVSLFGNTGNPESNLRKISDLLTKPIPNLLSFELTGTVKKQKIRSLYDPRNFIPGF